jgi:hypothetical protein
VRIGHKRRDRGSGSWHGTEQRPDSRTPDHRPEGRLQFRERRAHVAQAHLHTGRDDLHVIDIQQEVRHPEQAHRKGHEFQAVTQIRNTERHADLATVDIGADRATEQSEQCHRHALQRRSP